MNLTTYETFLNEKKATRSLLQSKVEKFNSNIQSGQTYLKDLKEALDIMNTVGVLVQQEFEKVVEELVTQALQFVFGDSYSFEVESEIARNQPEISMYISVDGERYSPRDEETSGGETDVASFALRVILWAIQYDRTEPVLIFDEPFRYVHGTRTPYLREMIRYLSDTLGIQFIIITDDDKLTEEADRSYLVVRENGISEVKLLPKDKKGEEY